MTEAGEIFVSTDIEADGPIPGPHSMLSFGSTAFAPDGTPLGTFSVNLDTLPGAAPHPATSAWWAQFPDAWQACRQNPRPPAEAMHAYLGWLRQLPGSPVFLGWPATWDFMWIYWYLIKFTGERPFAENGLDLRSYAMGMRGGSFRQTRRAYLPQRWFDPALPHTHVALDDAKEQGKVFLNMLHENLRRRET